VNEITLLGAMKELVVTI